MKRQVTVLGTIIAMGLVLTACGVANSLNPFSDEKKTQKAVEPTLNSDDTHPAIRVDAAPHSKTNLTSEQIDHVHAHNDYGQCDDLCPLPLRHAATN